MTKIQTFLLVGGLLLLVIISLWNFWRERSLEKKLTHALRASPHAEPDSNSVPHAAEPIPWTQKQEMTMELTDGHQPSEVQVAGDKQEDTPLGAGKPSSKIQVTVRPKLDSKLDLEWVFRGGGLISTEQFGQVLVRYLSEPSPLRWYGYEVELGQWIEVKWNAHHQFSAFSGVMMPVSRDGWFHPNLISETNLIIERIAADLEMVLQPFDIETNTRHFTRLYDFFERTDQVIAVNIVFPKAQPVSSHLLYQVFKDLGCEWHSDGAFYNQRRDFSLVRQDGTPFMELGNNPDAVPGISLILDIPRVKNIFQAFRDLFTHAEEITKRCSGKIVDDRGEAFGAKHLVGVEKKITELVQRMNKEDIPSGGPRALRLYSVAN